jgi:predicted transcriptional regulator
LKEFKLRHFRPGEKGLRKALGDLEADIMEIVWRNQMASVRDVCECLEKDREIAYTTVMTVMSRLSDKGLLRKEKDGKSYIYTPAISRNEFGRTFVSSLLAGLGHELSASALAFFVDNLSAEDGEALAELERLIDEKRKGENGNR